MGLVQLRNERGVETEMMALHQTPQIPVVVGVFHVVPADLPAVGGRHIGDHTKVPGSAAGITHGVDLQTAFGGFLCLTGEIVAGSGVGQGVVCGSTGDGVTELIPDTHLKGGLQADVLRQIADQRQPVFFGLAVPVVGPEYNVRIGIYLPDHIPDHTDPLGPVGAGEPTGVGLARFGLFVIV